MALKPKTPEPASTLPPINETFEAFIATQRPELDQRLDHYIANNSRQKEFADYLVARHPERAVRSLLKDKMLRFEQEMKIVERQGPQAEEWLSQQTPTLKVSIMERLKKISPFYQPAAKLRMIKSAKANQDFAPRLDLNQGMSL